jgi:hypothetical protein
LTSASTFPRAASRHKISVLIACIFNLPTIIVAYRIVHWSDGCDRIGYLIPYLLPSALGALQVIMFIRWQRYRFPVQMVALGAGIGLAWHFRNLAGAETGVVIALLLVLLVLLVREHEMSRNAGNGTGPWKNRGLD